MTDLEKKGKMSAEAVERLKILRARYKRGEISRETLKELAEFYIEIVDDYTKLVSKEHGVPFKKFSLMGFLR